MAKPGNDSEDVRSVRTFLKDAVAAKNRQVAATLPTPPPSSGTKKDLGHVFMPPPPPPKAPESLNQVFVPPKPESAPLPKNNPFGGGSYKHSSVLTSEGRVFDVSRAFGKGDESGIIVTDKKANRPALSAVLAAAFAERIHDLKETLKNTGLFNAEEDIVEVPEARRDIIKEASSPSATPPKDDFELALKKFKERGPLPQTPIVKPIIARKTPVQSLPTSQPTAIRTAPTPLQVTKPSETSSPTAEPMVIPKIADEQNAPLPEGIIKVLTPAPTPQPPLRTRIFSVQKTTATPQVERTPIHKPRIITATPKPVAPAPTSDFSPAPQNIRVEKTTTVPSTPKPTPIPQIPTPQKSAPDSGWSHYIEEKSETRTDIPQETKVPVPAPIPKPTPIIAPAPAVIPPIEIPVAPVPPPILKAEPVTPIPPEPLPAPKLEPEILPVLPQVIEPAPEPIYTALPLQAEAVPQRAAIREEKQIPVSIPEVIPEEVAPYPEPEPESEPVLSIEEIPVPEPEQEILPVLPPASAPAPEPEGISPLPTDLSWEDAEPEAAPVIFTKKTYSARRIDPDRLKIFSLGAIGVVILGGIIMLFVIFSEPEVVTEKVEIVIPSFVTVDSKIALPLESDRAVFFTNLKAAGETGTGIQQVYPTITRGTDGETTPAQTSEIFNVLKPRMDDVFLRSLRSDIMIGFVGTEKRAPFIILKSPKFDTAFAGMLAWESFMAEDLGPLFGTKDVSGVRFTDAINNNKSIRILLDQSGNERLIYALTNHDLIIITASTEALSTIISKLPQGSGL